VAIPEPGDLHLPAEGAGGVLELALERRRLDLDVDADARVADLCGVRLDRHGHGG
jgi:hypothetical protein